MIVLAKQIEGQTAHLGLMDIHVVRNAFGRQQESFETSLYVEGLDREVQAVFIRAPLIQSVDANVEVLAQHEGEIVAARQGHLLAVSFHPELTQDIGLHEYFLGMVQKKRTVQNV
ncbi:Glutamine amidotransferase subunit PdxT [compost metagenome]